MLMKLGSEQATTSGTAVNFTGIPAGTTMIVVMLDGVSTNGTGPVAIQLGDAGGLEATGYVGSLCFVANSTTGGLVNATTHIALTAVGAATGDFIDHTVIILTLKDAANNEWTWLTTGGVTIAGTKYATYGGGVKSLSAPLDRLSLVSDGADAFDAGSINIAYF